jgi:hypothetical protein
VIALPVAALPRGGRELEQLGRARQAADVGGEDAVLAAFHGVPVRGRVAAISVRRDRVVNVGPTAWQAAHARGQGLCAGAAM